jgi:hypothetical protein
VLPPSSGQKNKLNIEKDDMDIGGEDGWDRSPERTNWSKDAQSKPCIYVCIRVGHKTSPCIVTFNDLLCFPFQLTLY